MIEKKPEINSYCQVFSLRNEKCLCNFTVDDYLKKENPAKIKIEDIPLDKILEIMEDGNEFTHDGYTNFFSILTDKNDYPYRFHFYLKY